MDPATHKRFLDYRAKHAYFGRNLALLSMSEFEEAERAYRTLEVKGEQARDDEEESRFQELARLLLLD
jgi:hypothetical protein